MRHKMIVATILVSLAIAASGCSLDEVFSLDVTKNKCKDVKSLEIYTYNDDGSVKSRSLCREGDECTKNNDYRGALKFGICPNDISVCMEGEEKFCAVCSQGSIVCGKEKTQVMCVNPLINDNYCGAKGLCNSTDPSSADYKGVKCDTENGFHCAGGQCFSDSACDPDVQYPICDGSKVIDCVNNKKRSTKCGALEVCEAGACAAQPCDEHYNDSCSDDGDRIFCDSGRVKKANCENGECVAGECKRLRCDADPNYKVGACSEDGGIYYACSPDGRQEPVTCTGNTKCIEGKGCSVECDKNVCYENPTEEQKNILRRCVDGVFKDEKCSDNNTMYCYQPWNEKVNAYDGASCICTKGAQRCSEKGVETCIEESGLTKWVVTEKCTSDKPICDDEEFYCHDEAQAIGSPCQIVVTDNSGKRHYCNNEFFKNDGTNKDVELDKYCKDMMSGTQFSKLLNTQNIIDLLTIGYGYPAFIAATAYGALESELKRSEDFFVYDRNIFPKDKTVIKGCKNVEVPEGMALGCLTSDASLKFNQIGNYMEAFKQAKIFSESLHQWLERFMTEMFDTENGGVKFTAPNGYCMVGAYDLTIRGYVFDELFSAPSEEGGYHSLGLHSNPDEKLVGYVDLVNTTARHKEALNAQCPEGSFGFHYTEPLMRDGKIGQEDFLGRLGYDLCLKTCETKEDCRDGYNCIKLPTRAPDMCEVVSDVIEAGEFQKACMNSETYKVMHDMRYKVFGGEERPSRADCEEEDECRADIERDWANDNNHYEPKEPVSDE
ncbi:MAG: hypothetical protein IKY83_09125 [Proteobacteria bacterium]|nr:hypothetical protein [Pseudomonadota bacterium]